MQNPGRLRYGLDMGKPATEKEKLHHLKALCDHIALKGSLKSYCEKKGNPSVDAVLRWRREFPDADDWFARARSDRADARLERIDELVGMAVSGKLDPQTARVAIDAEKWAASKENPRIYGDKIDISGKIDHQHSVSSLMAAILPQPNLMLTQPRDVLEIEAEQAEEG